MAFLLGIDDSWAQSIREKDPISSDTLNAATIVWVALVGFLWFLGICAGLKWTFLGSAAWRRGQVARATAQVEAKREEERNKVARAAAAIEAKREKERNEAEESARRAKAAKQMAELAEMRHAEERREQARRDAALVPLYGGEVRFVEMVKKGSIALGMTRAAVEASWGSPADIREEISASRHRVRLFFGREVGARGKVTYRHEVVLLGNRVVSIKDL
jgi:F0F1-type ATP synthase membrane subunit b/b'